MHRIHASAVAIDHQAVLLLGPSGVGKSDLALRLIDEGAELIADDIVVINSFRDQLTASPAPNGTGLLEVHGIGILRDIAYRQNIPIKIAFELDRSDGTERLQSASCFTIENIDIPLFKLNPMSCSAAAKVRALTRYNLLPQDLLL